MSNLPEKRPHRQPVHPALYRAAVSPTAIAATAIGAGIGVADHSIVVGVILAVGGWTTRMVGAVVGRRRRDRKAAPHPAQLDPWSVPEPWRDLVQQAASIQSRFESVIAEWPPGPIRDRIQGLRPSFYQEFSAVGSIASHGAALTGWTSGAAPVTSAPSAQRLSSELEQARAERVALGDRSPSRAAELDRREEAVAAQLRAVRAAQQMSDSVQNRLRVIVSRLDEAVTHLLTLSIETGGTAGVEQVSEVLTELDDELGALRAGVAETRAVEAGTPPDPLTL